MKKIYITLVLAIVAVTTMAQSKPLTGLPQTAKIPDTVKTVTYTITENDLKAIYAAVSDAGPLIAKYPATNEKQAAAAFSVLNRLNSIAEYLTEKFNSAHPQKQK